MPEQQEPKSSTPDTQPPEIPGLGQAAGPIQDISMQPTPTIPTSDPAQLPPTPPPPPPGHSQRIPNWLYQAERFIRVIVRMYLGLLVCLAPWFPAAWDANPLFASSPTLLAFVSQGWVRGVVSGLGLLNLYIALRDAIRDPNERR